MNKEILCFLNTTKKRICGIRHILSFLAVKIFFSSFIVVNFPYTLSAAQNLANISFESKALQLPPWQGVSYEVDRFSGVSISDGKFSWVGQLLGVRPGFVSLGKVGDEISLTVSFSDGEVLTFRGKADDFSWELQKTTPKPCGGCRVDNELPADPRMRQQPVLSWQNGDANLIDLLVVYPNAVTTAAGSTAAIQADILSSVADTNLCYRNSNLNIQLRLVHMEEIVYTPTGILDDDLSRLKDKADGFMDSVHSTRDQYGADLVALLTTASDAGGLASTMKYPSMAFESSGFSVNVWDQIGAPSYTLAHEIGHNMGCLHNVEDSNNVTSSYVFGAFCYGKRWLAGGQGYRTVMSYDTSPNSTYPNTVPYFSNPTVSYQGTTTGESGSADNALVLRSTAPYVSNFRSSTVQGIVATMYDVQVTEGNYSTLGIRLATKPTSPISVNLSLSGDADIVLGTPASLTFDANNWNLLQTVQIHALADANSTGDTSTLLLSANAMPSASVSITEVDNGTALPGTHIISGVVVNSLGVGLEGVPLSFSNGGGVTHSDPTGAFSMELASGWSGTFVPSSNSYAFSPSQLSVSALSQSSTGHVFQGARSHILYVNTNASGAGDGSSWADAFTDLGDALRATVPYSEIWVAQGNYRPGLVRSSHFLIPPGKEVYGGFAGGETDINRRNPVANPTILSGDIGISDDFSDNTFHVVIPSHESILDGFTVIGGNASENFSNDDRGKGAGLWAESSAFTVRNCTFSNNMAYQGGAGIYLKEVNASFLSCTFSLNVAGSSGTGGAAYLEDSNVSFQSCSFSSNDAGFQAGAVRWENSTGVMIDSNFTSNRNTASNGGGALFLTNSSPDILRCHFAENSTLANNYGGAIKMDDFNGSIIDSIFTRNQSLVNAGGAIYVDVNSTPVFSGNEYHHNSAVSFGGAIFVEDSNLSLDGDIFLGNSAEVGGAIGTQGGAGVNIRNVRALGNEANATGTGSGGFIYLSTGTTGSIFVNSVFSGNKANGRSGVLRANGTSRFVNCTLVGNHAGDLGGISILFSANNDLIEFDNSIIWGNTSANGGNDISVNSGTVTATSSIFDPSQSSGTISGSNNSSADPSFVDADGLDDLPGTLDDDLRLLAGSPAIDNGSTSVADFLSTDLAGNARVGPPEIGAYEYSTNFLPLISTANTLNIIEGSSAVGTIQATDSDGDTLTFSITGGDDQALFLINAGTGALSFASPPDFETPSDLNGDNVYELQIEVNDGTGSSSLSLQVTLLNSNEPPVSISSLGGLTIPENEAVGTTVGHFTASDPDAGASFTYALVSGAGDSNNTLFTLESNGTLKSASVLDYEEGSVLSIRARVTDENGGLLEGNFTILVTDVYEAPANLHSIDLNASVNIEMLWVEPGTFTMGSPLTEAGRQADENETQVTLTQGFYLGKYEVTQAQYEAVMTGVAGDLNATPSNFLGNPNRPVEQVSWDDVQVFLQRLNFQQAGDIPAGWAYVLPTEAQWEYACRAGTTTVYSWGDTISASDANWDHGNDANATEGVGQYAPNPWGFFDMHGNVFEWCADWYGAYNIGPLTDPLGAASGLYRGVRGGSWNYGGTTLRSARRSGNAPSARHHHLGFRLGFQKITDPPVDLNSTSPLTILENQPIGTFVGEFNATDPDSNGSLTYSLVSGSGDDNNSLFVLDHNGTLRTTVPLDYETGDHLSILVQVADDQNATQVRNFTVQVLNENEPPVISHTQINITIDEDSNLSQINITASDPDVGEILTWNVIQPHEANGSAYFTGNVNSPSNFIYVPDPNFNGQDSLKLTVTDVTGLTSEVEINLTITPVEDFPEIALSGTSPYQIFTPENLKSIGILSAFDPDGQPLNFSINGGVDADLFTIDASTGELSFVSTPDYESPTDSDQNNYYQVDIQVIDTAGNTASQSISVVVQDMIDFSFVIFTNAGATGRIGPTQAQVNAAYIGTDLDGRVTINTQGIQEWTVPFSGMYSIEAWGARGGAGEENSFGLGAKMKGEFQLQEGDNLEILVGQMGETKSEGGGGGGASYVIANTIPLIIAGGGGGTGDDNPSPHPGASGSTLPDGNSGGVSTSSLNPSNGGTAGNGGSSTGSYSGGGGGGFFGNGIGNYSGMSFSNGGTGGNSSNSSNGEGGFGGGAGANYTGGGAGGYSGGGAGSPPTDSSGGGGGSFNSGTNQVNLSGANGGHGKVIISAINRPPSDLLLANNSLPENLQQSTHIGLFSAADPDDPAGAGTYFYTFVSGAGDTHNSLFNLDLNGSLSSNTTGDYESSLSDSAMGRVTHGSLLTSLEAANYPASLFLTPQNQYPTWSIRVRVSDAFGAFFEKEISIALLDRDDVKPIIALTGSANLVHEAASVYQDGGANWTDNVDGGGVLVANGTVNVMVPGSYTLTYDITDAAGNVANQVIRTVTVVDSIKPVITLGGNANIIHEAATAYSDDGASWADAVDGNGTLIANGAMNVMVPGTYTLTYDITDTAGNMADQVVRTITVVDSTKPMITLLGEDNITQEGAIAYSDQGAIWDDTVDGNGSIIASGIVDVMVPGNYTLTYDITDSAGNVADQVSRTVTVVDTTKPVISLLGNATVIHEGATGYSDVGATWTDTVDGNGSIVTNGFVDVMVPGSYILTYDIGDKAGNNADQIIRTVNLVDTTKPVITLNGDANISHVVASVYSDEGAVWTDTIDGNGSIAAVGNVDVMVPGMYTLTYDVSDVAGNAATQVERLIHVVNRDPDSLFIDQNVVEENYPAGFYIGTLGTTDPDDPQGIHSYTYELIAVDNGASDGFDIAVDGRVSTTRTFDFEKQEKYILSLRVRDAFGGKYEQDIEIRIIDAFIPLVETVGVSLDSNYTLQMEGFLVDEGGTSGVLDVGFIISEIPIVSISQTGLFAVSANLDANFSFVHAEPLNIGSQKIYIRAFAETEEGVNLGLEEIVRVPEVSNPSLWSDAMPLESAQGWWGSDWFGTFYNGVESGWILHQDLGWLYPSPSVIGGVWLWKDSFGWLWTDQQKFPFLFSENSQAWLYYYGVLNQRRLLFDYGTGQWIVLDESKVMEREGAR